MRHYVQYLMIVFFTIGSLQVLAQRTVKGTVTGEDNEPLVGVNIIIKGTNTGTISDVNGGYSLDVQDDDAVLIFSFIGYETQEIRVGVKSILDASLMPDAESLEEVVVVGYAVQRDKDITGAVESLSAKDLPEAPVAQVGQLLQGRMAGVNINQNSGRPGEGLNFRIRGAFSLTAGSDPLYVVDGMPLEGNISNLNPNEIESISVLKDAAAASLYGSRAANGVILVQTKTGTPGETNINFNAYYGVEQVPENRRLDMMNAQEYAQFQRELAITNGRPINPVFENPEALGEGTDWFEEIVSPAPVQSYNLSVNTATDKTNVSAVLGYFNQDGVVEGTGFERLSLRLNTKYNISENVRVGLNVAPYYTFNTNFATDGWPYVSENLVASALITTPLASPFNEDGSLALTASDPATFGNPNWLRVAREKVYEDRNFELLSNAYFEYDIIPDLTFKATGNIQYGTRNIFEFNPSTIGTLFAPPPSIPSGSDNTIRFTNWVNENSLNYRKSFGDHNIDALIGVTAQHYRSDGNLISASNFPDDKVQTVNAANQVVVNTNVQEWSLMSYLARLNYSFRDKYLFTASVRRDGSSRFGPNNRWGNFPAASVGWIVSEEDFFDVGPVSFFKVRASYGITGNFQIGNYTFRSTLNELFYPFGNGVVSGRGPNNIGDQSLGWENNKQLNIGSEIYLFNDKIQLTYNYYKRTTEDLLFNVEVPVSSGFNTIQTNIGEVDFWGHEFMLQANIINKRDFTWNMGANISFDRNEVVSLGTEEGILPSGLLLYQFRSHRSEVGLPLAQFYGAIHDGVYVDQADFDNSPTHASSQVGTVKFRDLNDDGTITFPEDMTYIGNPWPDFTYGITQTVRYKNFSLMVVMAGSHGNDILTFYENWMGNLDGVFNVLSEVQDRWKSPEDPGSGKYGSVAQGTTFLERDRWNSRYIKDGSFLAVKNITLGYNFPLNESSVFKNARVYTSIQNAFLFTNYPGPNPEVNTQVNGPTSPIQSSIGNVPGVDENSYPIPRTISLGVNLGF